MRFVNTLRGGKVSVLYFASANAFESDDMCQ